ncbi:hypothetical protein XH90_31890 [Bradyrhizobium sp. CCBAU 53338]|nr:hypothetical protein XH90_31890 [Bradyrhizobium sp. CCBAU 53338]
MAEFMSDGERQEFLLQFTEIIEEVVIFRLSNVYAYRGRKAKWVCCRLSWITWRSLIDPDAKRSRRRCLEHCLCGRRMIV